MGLKQLKAQVNNGITAELLKEASKSFFEELSHHRVDVLSIKNMPIE